MRFHPLIQNSSRYFSRLKRVFRTQTFTSREYHFSSQLSRFSGQLRAGSPFVQPDKNRIFLRFFIGDCASTLYVGLARKATPTNTKFRLTFLLTRLQEALYEDLTVKSIKFEVYHLFSGLSFISKFNFLSRLKQLLLVIYSY